MPPKDDGGDPEPKVDDKVGPPSKDDFSNLGNGLDVGSTLGTGQKLVAGAYTLKIKDGALIETGPDGKVIYSSQTADPNNKPTGDARGDEAGKTMGFRLDKDGLDQQVNSYYQATTGWQLKALDPKTGEPIDGDKIKRLQLNEDGSLVFLGADGTVLSVVQPPDKFKHALVIQLYHPTGDTGGAEGYTKGVLHTTIDAVQEYMQVSVDLMGVGTPSKAPDFDDLIKKNTGLEDFTDQSKMIDAYSRHLDGIQTAKDKMHELALTKDVPVDDIKGQAAEARDKIEKIRDDLNAVLRAPDKAKNAPKEVKEKAIDITYEANGDIKKAEIPATTVKFLLGELQNAVEDVRKVVSSVSDTAGGGKKTINENSPEYQAGKKAGYEQGKAEAEKANAGKGNPTGNDTPTDPTTDPTADPTAQQTDYSQYFPDNLGQDTGPQGQGNDDSDPLGLGDNKGDGSTKGDGTTTGDGSTDPFQAAIDKIVASGTNAANAGMNMGTGGNQQGFNPANMMGMFNPANMMGMGQPGSQNPMSQYGLPGMMGQEGSGSRMGMSPYGNTSGQAANAMSTARTTNGGTVSANPAQSLGATPNPAVAPKSGSIVDMTLKDDPNHPQTVSSIVSQAVTKEMSNPNGTDVAAAYAGTPAAQTEHWTPRDPSQLASGDVATWGDNRTGLVVMENGQPHIIINGKSQLLDPEHSPDGNRYAGFYHPAGIDVPQKSAGGQTAQVSADGGTQNRSAQPQARV